MIFLCRKSKAFYQRNSKIVGYEKYIYTKDYMEVENFKSMQSIITKNNQTKNPHPIYKSYKNCIGPIIETY